MAEIGQKVGIRGLSSEIAPFSDSKFTHGLEI